MKRNLFIILFVLLFGNLLTNPLYAQIEQVILRVDGLACPFCAYGLEKKITQIEGTQSYDVDMKEGKVYVDLSEDAKVNIDAFRKAVKEAGFTLRTVFLKARGTVEKTETGFALVVGASHEKLLLFESEKMVKKYHQGDDPNSLAMSEELSGQLLRIAGERKEVKIEGRVHAHGGLPSGLAVEKLEIL